MAQGILKQQFYFLLPVCMFWRILKAAIIWKAKFGFAAIMMHTASARFFHFSWGDMFLREETNPYLLALWPIWHLSQIHQIWSTLWPNKVTHSLIHSVSHSLTHNTMLRFSLSHLFNPSTRFLILIKKPVFDIYWGELKKLILSVNRRNWET